VCAILLLNKVIMKNLYIYNVSLFYSLYFKKIYTKTFFHFYFPNSLSIFIDSMILNIKQKVTVFSNSEKLSTNRGQKNISFLFFHAKIVRYHHLSIENFLFRWPQNENKNNSRLVYNLYEKSFFTSTCVN